MSGSQLPLFKSLPHSRICARTSQASSRDGEAAWQDSPGQRGYSTRPFIQVGFAGATRARLDPQATSAARIGRSLLYIRPNADMNGTEGVHFFRGEEDVLEYYANSKSMNADALLY
jgi:PKD repeat protein